MWSISLPFKYKKVKNSKRMTYLVILGIFLPSVSIIATTSRFSLLKYVSQNITVASEGGVGYIPFTWPSIYCGSFTMDNDMHAFITNRASVSCGRTFVFCYFLYSV